MNILAAQTGEGGKDERPVGLAIVWEDGGAVTQEMEGMRPPTMSELFWALWVMMGAFLSGEGSGSNEPMESGVNSPGDRAATQEGQESG